MARGDNLAKVRKKTQFKLGNEAHLGKPASTTYRQQLEWIRDYLTDSRDIDTIIKELLDLKPSKTRTKISIARIFVVRYLERALKKVDPQLFERIINQTEGNLVQVIKTPDDLPIPEDHDNLQDASDFYKSNVPR